MAKFNVYSESNEGGSPVVVCDDKGEAVKEARELLFDPDLDPPLTPEEKEVALRGISLINDDSPIEILGSAAWKEIIFVVPLDDSCSP